MGLQHAEAQGLPAQRAFAGRVGNLNCAAGTPEAELRPPNGDGAAVPTRILMDGSFSFAASPGGYNVYELSVYCGNRRVVRQLVAHDELVRGVDIWLPEDKAARPVSGIVDVRLWMGKPSKKVRKLYAAAMRAQTKGDLTQAIELTGQALEEAPGWFDAVNRLGILFVRAGRFAEAVELLQLVAEKLPNDARAWSNSALALWGAGRLEESSQSFERSLALDPNNPIVRRESARLDEYRALLAQRSSLVAQASAQRR